MKQKGFSNTIIIVLIVLVSVLGAVGWFLNERNNVTEPEEGGDILKNNVVESVNFAPKIIEGSVLSYPPLQPEQLINFRWVGYDKDGDNLSWSVNWGDGTALVGKCPASNNSEVFDASHMWQKSGIYAVKATANDCNGGSNSDSPGNFTITVGDPGTPLITVLSPNGGEVWQIGSTYTISWEIKDFPSDSKINIQFEGDGVIWNLYNSYEFAESVDWTVPNHVSITPGSYVINAYIIGGGKFIASDKSDAQFSIVE